jgi:hypothetical protein
MKNYNFQMWIDTDPHDWPFGEEFKVYAEIVKEGSSYRVGNVRVLFRGLTDITSALMESEVEKLALKCAETYAEAK